MTFRFPPCLRRLAAAAAFLPLLPGGLTAQEPSAAKSPTEAVAPAAAQLTLGECLGVARERRPMVRAAILSYQASEASYAALFNLGTVPDLVTPDLPIRKQQAERGLTLAAAEVQKALQETTQDVTVLYYSYVYAKQQEQTAADISEQLGIYYDIAEGIVKSGARQPGSKLDQFSLYALQNVIDEVKAQKLKAETGRKLALEALRDAMGVGMDYDFVPAAQELPLMLGGTVTKEQVVADATARRPELAQAAAGVDAFRLEVCAQAAVKYKRQVPTLASGSDLHSKQVPMAMRNGEYRPGAIAPEMPGTLVGRTAERVQKATLLSQRQDALYDHTASLIRLDAAKAYLAWDAATKQVKDAKEKFERGKRLLEQSRAAAIARQDPQLLVMNEALAGKAQSEYVDAVYAHIKTLAALERITAGGVTTQFPGR
jgi:outer membrane protein TolC